MTRFAMLLTQEHDSVYPAFSNKVNATRKQWLGRDSPRHVEARSWTLIWAGKQLALVHALTSPGL